MTALRPTGVGENDIVRAYFAYSCFIAILAFALPLALIVSSFVFDDGMLKESLSAYYHGENIQRDLFVGTLCAVAVFLGLYKGWRGWEATLLNIAGVAAFLTAVVPTPEPPKGLFSPHAIAALTLFGCIILVGVVLPWVRKKMGGPAPPPLVGYVISAVIMIAGAAVAILAALSSAGGPLLFWGEVLLVAGFGIFWLLRTRHLADPDVRPRLLD